MVGSPKAIDTYIGKFGALPVTKSAISKSPVLQKSEFIKSFIQDVVPATVILPTGPEYAECSEIIMTGVQEAITTTKSIDAILADGQKKLEALFKK